MSFFVIIRGPLGIGKTTIAKKVAGKTGALYISVDEILAKHKLDHVTGRCILLKNFIKGNKIILSKAKSAIQKGKPVVFDGNFYHKGQITHLIRKINAPHYVFTLKAPLKTCIERDRQRKNSYGKDSVLAVYNLVSKFDYGKTINTQNKTAEQAVKEIVALLG